MFLRFVFTLGLASVLLLDSGCAWHGRPKPRAKAASVVSKPILVGTISLVNEEGKFALIDNGTSPVPPVGGPLESFTGEVKSGELVTTQARRHPFTIADIRSGQPQKGDRVIYQPVTGGAKPTPGTQAAAPAPVPGAR
jgi:hypothetical protein